MTQLRAAAERVYDVYRASGPLWTAALMLDHLGLPMLRFWPPRTISSEALSDQVAKILKGFGLSDEHISITTDYLMYADLHGIDSHGCGMLLQYYRGFAAGELNPNPKIEVIRESETTALIDGGGGLGHVPGDVAIKLAIEKCKQKGIGAVSVRNSGHYGAAGAYVRLAAQAGCIGISTTNTGIPSVVPTFGMNAMLGTNPIAFAAPAKQNSPFLLDMATSTVPLGKIMMAAHRGNSIPIGWALTPDGTPETNPKIALKHRRLTPLGSNEEMSNHKGYGLATMVEILSSVLSGLRPESKPVKYEPRVGHFFLAIDPRQFREEGEFESDLDQLMDSLRRCPPNQLAKPVLVAGDPEYTAYTERKTKGIPILHSVIQDLRTVCKATGVPFILDSQNNSHP